MNTATGVTTEMFPNSGDDFAFDSVEADDGLWTGASEERSIVKGGGSYNVIVQWAVTDPTSTFRLDDWSFSVEQIAH